MPSNEPNLVEMAFVHRCGGCGYDLSAVERAAQAEEAAGQARGYCLVTCPECGRPWHLSAVWVFGNLDPRLPVPDGAKRGGSQDLSTRTIVWILVPSAVVCVCIDSLLAGRVTVGLLTVLFILGVGMVLLLMGIISVVDQFTDGPFAMLKVGFDREGVWAMNRRSGSQCVAPRGDWLVEVTSVDDWVARLLIWERPSVGERPNRLVMQVALQCRPEDVREAESHIVAALGLGKPPPTMTEAPAAADSSSGGVAVVAGGDASVRWRANGQG